MRCVYPDCDNSARTRGLCHAMYQAMRSAVRTIEKTQGDKAARAFEDDLEVRGLLMPKGTGGSPARDHLGAFKVGSQVKGFAPMPEDAEAPGESWEARAKAVLASIDVEFRTDARAVQCFDAQLVGEVRDLVGCACCP